VTRLGDVSELGGLGVPTVQAVRPQARSLTVSQGKGLTRMAATVSALLEASELHAAEALRPPAGAPVPLRALGDDAMRVWATAPRDPLAVRLDPGRPRHWLQARDLRTGQPRPVPFDLLSLDCTRAPPPDLPTSSAGLATGNTRLEALIGGLGELLEHDLAARLEEASPPERRRAELDLASVDDQTARRLLAGFAARGAAVRVWSLGQEAGAASFACSLWRPGSDMIPAGGSGCHPDRSVALVAALLEAAQSQATLVAGARDDLTPERYRGAADHWLGLVTGGLSFGPGPLGWRETPHLDAPSDEEALDALLAAAARLSALPVMAFDHAPPCPGLHLVHCAAPGLANVERGRSGVQDIRDGRARTSAPPRRRASRRAVLFAGPSLPVGARFPDLEVRPPAVCGDLAALIDDPPPAVGLADGCFELAPTVWHKELLDLIAHGVAVLGGASLGAIRAAELATHGMRGVGTVFVAYAAGAVVRDDAVMLDHAPAELDHRPLTLALVDAEHALRQVAMPSEERRVLQRIARTTHYRDRTWSRCLALYAKRTGRRAAVEEATLAAVPSLKERDALALARAVTLAATEPREAGPRPPLTGDYLRLLATARR
jgi:YcaO-like protein with predicted kinase domain